jgi:beta-glucosidase
MSQMLTMLACLLTAMSSSHNSADVEKRVDKALSQLSLQEKLELIGGQDDFYIRAEPKIGTPRIKMSDGPVGLRNDGPTTAYPAGVDLAACWDPNMASRFGTAIGRDARSRGVNIWLGPGVNLARIVQNGRNFEYLGEDPLLAAQNATAIVKAVQAQGVVPTVKHFAANNHENDRNVDSSDVDERTLRELYLRAFEKSVVDGGAWAVMCGYNKINGTYDSENSWLLQQTLKTDWNFKGVLMSDWGAVHSTQGAALHGMDLEMPSGEFMNPTTLTPLVDNGTVPVAVIDDKVRRILRLIYSMGFDKRPQEVSSIPRDDPQNAKVALDIAREGTVLLKNSDGLLPLSRAKVKKIVVLGPNAEPAVTGGGGSSYTQPFHSISVFDAVKAAAGPGVQVEYFPLLGDSIKEALGAIEFAGPVHAEYWDNPDLSGPSVITRTEPAIDHEWLTQPVKPVQGRTGFSARYTCRIKVPAAGNYLLMSREDDGARVYIDDNLAIDDWNDHAATIKANRIRFDVPGEHNLKVEFYDHGGEAIIQVGLLPLDSAFAKDLPAGSIEDADAVIAAVGFNPGSEGEGQDRPFQLPYLQEMLIRELVSRSNKVVILNHSGAGVDMSHWVDKAGAILQDWYPGENGNKAVAEILFGDKNPSGKLPTTFPRTLEGTYYATAYPPIDHHIAYTEGLLMGYRWFDTKNQAPLFPFGYGLSYTTFAISGLKVSAHGDHVTATVTLQNTGQRSGAEVVQVYVGKPDSKIERPTRELKAFSRVELKPGEKKQVTLNIEPYWLSYWNVAAHKWSIEPGSYSLWVGNSSRDLTAKATFKL